MLRITTEKQQVADKLEEKEQKYKKLSETVRIFFIILLLKPSLLVHENQSRLQIDKGTTYRAPSKVNTALC